MYCYVQLPQTLSGVISSRLDKLPSSPLLTVKVCSAFGQEIDVEILKIIYPVKSVPPEQIDEDLKALVQHGFMKPGGLKAKSITLGSKYVFCHKMTYEVAYELLLYKHRQELHTAIGEYYEKELALHANEESKFIPILAFHWSRASDVRKAAKYLEKAAMSALLRRLNRVSSCDVVMTTGRCGVG